MQFISDSRTITPPKSMKKMIQNISGAWQYIPGCDKYIQLYDKFILNLVCTVFCYFWLWDNMWFACDVYAGIFKHREIIPKHERLMVALCVYTVMYFHMPAYLVTWRYITVYAASAKWGVHTYAEYYGILRYMPHQQSGECIQYAEYATYAHVTILHIAKGDYIFYFLHILDIILHIYLHILHLQ